MIKRFWVKSAMLALTGTVFGLGLGGGCLQATVQRVLTAVLFD